MVNWRHKIHIGPEHAAYRRDEIEPDELGRRVAAKLRACPAFVMDPTILGAIARDFETVEDIDEYDSALAWLYNWSDIGNRLWVDTFHDEPTAADIP